MLRVTEKQTRRNNGPHKIAPQKWNNSWKSSCRAPFRPLGTFLITFAVYCFNDIKSRGEPRKFLQKEVVFLVHNNEKTAAGQKSGCRGIAIFTFLAAPHNLARSLGERFFAKARFGKRRNTLCTRKGHTRIRKTPSASTAAIYFSLFEPQNWRKRSAAARRQIVRRCLSQGSSCTRSRRCQRRGGP